MAGASPDFANDTALLAAMKLCTGIGPTVIMAMVPLGPLMGRHGTRAAIDAHARRRRAAPQMVWDSTAATATARWIRALTDDWCDIFRDVRRKDDVSASPGGRLVLLVAMHAAAVFSTRRTLLKTVPGYPTRTRDPALPAARPVAGVRLIRPADESSELPSISFISPTSMLRPASIADESIVCAQVLLSSPCSS